MKQLNYRNVGKKSKSTDRHGRPSKLYREAFPAGVTQKPHEIIAMNKDFDAHMIQELFPDRAIKAQNFIDLIACNRKNDK